MGQWALEMIRETFGDIPPSVLTNPSLLSGHRFYVGSEKTEELIWPTALSCRKDLDFWMVQKTLKSGVHLRNGVRVAHITPLKGGCRVNLGKGSASSYIKSLGPILETIGRLCKVQDNLKTAANGGPIFLAKALKDAYRKTLTLQEN